MNLKVTALEVEFTQTIYEDHRSLLISEGECAML